MGPRTWMFSGMIVGFVMTSPVRPLGLAPSVGVVASWRVVAGHALAYADPARPPGLCPPPRDSTLWPRPKILLTEVPDETGPRRLVCARNEGVNRSAGDRMKKPLRVVVKQKEGTGASSRPDLIRLTQAHGPLSR